MMYSTQSLRFFLDMQFQSVCIEILFHGFHLLEEVTQAMVLYWYRYITLVSASGLH